MFEILLVNIFAIVALFFCIHTKRKILKQNKACNIVLDMAKLKSDNLSIDDVVCNLKNSNTKIVYKCLY